MTVIDLIFYIDGNRILAIYPNSKNPDGSLNCVDESGNISTIKVNDLDKYKVAQSHNQINSLLTKIRDDIALDEIKLNILNKWEDTFTWEQMREEREHTRIEEAYRQMLDEQERQERSDWSRDPD